MSKNRTDNPNVASDRIDFLEKDEIFVFGSNLEGKHLGGAAKAAHMKFGAKWGVGVGLTGQTSSIIQNNSVTLQSVVISNKFVTCCNSSIKVQNICETTNFL